MTRFAMGSLGVLVGMILGVQAQEVACKLSVDQQPHITWAQDCDAEEFSISVKVSCTNAGGVGCPGVTLYAEIYEQVNGQWFYWGAQPIVSWRLNCGTSGAIDWCWTPKPNVVARGNQFRIYLGLQAGVLNPGGAVISNIDVISGPQIRLPSPIEPVDVPTRKP